MLAYLKGWSDSLHHGEGWLYLEIDTSLDLVVRQVEVCGSLFRWGRWTGLVLEGAICDQPPSTLDLISIEFSAWPEFEAIWLSARDANATGW
jgi:hypothetical protein